MTDIVDSVKSQVRKFLAKLARDSDVNPCMVDQTLGSFFVSHGEWVKFQVVERLSSLGALHLLVNEDCFDNMDGCGVDSISVCAGDESTTSDVSCDDESEDVPTGGLDPDDESATSDILCVEEFDDVPTGGSPESAYSAYSTLVAAPSPRLAREDSIDTVFYAHPTLQPRTLDYVDGIGDDVLSDSMQFMRCESTESTDTVYLPNDARVFSQSFIESERRERQQLPDMHVPDGATDFSFLLSPRDWVNLGMSRTAQTRLCRTHFYGCNCTVAPPAKKARRS